MSISERRSKVDKEDSSLSISAQCRLLGLNRSTLYYRPSTACARDLLLMRLIDELYLEDPARGTRRMSACLKERGHKVGRDKVRSLMNQLRIKPL